MSFHITEENAGVGGNVQFDIAAHYNVMVQLDQDVHDDDELSRAEAQAALEIATRELGYMPKVVFTPCFGTGRHTRFLLEAGVERVIGVDLSPLCVAKARSQFKGDDRVEFHVGDLSDPELMARFADTADACILLGNSFADVVDPELLGKVTSGMCIPLKAGGVFVMDYVADNYLGRCADSNTSTWDALLDGRNVRDARTPRFDEGSGVMTIDVYCTYADGEDAGETAWTGFYQKLILDAGETCTHFANNGNVELEVIGPATEVNPHYAGRNVADLGMIGASTWFMGRKVS